MRRGRRWRRRRWRRRGWRRVRPEHVAAKDVLGRVAVARVQVGGGGVESEEAPAARDRELERVGVPLGTGSAGGAADEGGRARLYVACERVRGRIAAGRAEDGCEGGER